MVHTKLTITLTWCGDFFSPPDVLICWMMLDDHYFNPVNTAEMAVVEMAVIRQGFVGKSWNWMGHETWPCKLWGGDAFCLKPIDETGWYYGSQPARSVDVFLSRHVGWFWSTPLASYWCGTQFCLLLRWPPARNGLANRAELETRQVLHHPANTRTQHEKQLVCSFYMFLQFFLAVDHDLK